MNIGRELNYFWLSALPWVFTQCCLLRPKNIGIDQVAKQHSIAVNIRIAGGCRCKQPKVPKGRL